MTQLESPDQTLRLLERGLSEAGSSSALSWFSVPAPLLRAEALLGLEPQTDAWYWADGRDQELVGLGVAKRLTGRGANRFETIDRQLQELWLSLEPHTKPEAGTPEPRVVGGFAFQAGRASQSPWDGFGEGQLVLPRLMYTRREDRAWLTLTAASNDFASSHTRERLLREAERLLAAAADVPNGADTAPGPFELAERSADEWREQIERVKRAIAEGSLEKVVLARRVLVRFARPLSPT